MTAFKQKPSNHIDLMPWGKYKGKAFNWVLERDRKYLIRIYRSKTRTLEQIILPSGYPNEEFTFKIPLFWNGRKLYEVFPTQAGQVKFIKRVMAEHKILKRLLFPPENLSDRFFTT